MALMEVNFFSEILGLNCQANVIVPQSGSGIGVQSAKRKASYPVLWLLHGASDDHTIWLRRTSIERYVSPLGLIVVMPQAHLSSYTNMAHGPKYFDFFTTELPRIMGDFFPVSPEREDNYIAGLSMGGYGALSLGLGRPDRYSAIGCFSAGNLNFARNKSNSPQGKRKSGKASRNMTVFGLEDLSTLRGHQDYDCFVKAEQAIQAKSPLPRIFHCCGTEDFSYENACETAEWFQAHPQFDYEFHDGPGGHTWDFWDEWVQTFLAWLLRG